MTPKQINEMKGTALAFLAIIVCTAIAILAVEVHKHKSAYKLPNHSITHKLLK